MDLAFAPPPISLCEQVRSLLVSISEKPLWKEVSIRCIINRCMDVRKNITEEVRNPAGINLFKVNNRNTRARCQICSKLTIKTPKRRQ